MYAARNIAVDTLQKNIISNICVKYCLLTLFDTCCGGTGMPPFRLSFLGRLLSSASATETTFTAMPSALPRNPLSYLRLFSFAMLPTAGSE
jgi:hypothetical protein